MVELSHGLYNVAQVLLLATNHYRYNATEEDDHDDDILVPM